MTLDIIVPARNEADVVGKTILMLRGVFENRARIVVVDNGSDDGTREVAISAGADKVLDERRLGKGYAVWRGLSVCGPGKIFVCDADIRGLTTNATMDAWRVSQAMHQPMLRLSIGRSVEHAPVTNLLVRPVLRVLGFGEELKEPIGGLLFVDRDFALRQHLSGGWGFDISLTAAVLKEGFTLPEVDVTSVIHRYRDVSAYSEMAQEVAEALLHALGIVAWDHHDCVKCNDAA